MQSNAESRIFNLTFTYSKFSRKTRIGVGIAKLSEQQEGVEAQKHSLSQLLNTMGDDL